MYRLQGTSDAIAWYWYRRSSLRFNKRTQLRLNTRKAWERPAMTDMSLSIVQDNGDKKVSMDESRVQDMKGKQCYDRASWTVIFSFPLSLYYGHPPFAHDLQTMRLLSYLLHALPSPSLYYLRVHQYLLMCTLCAPPMPVPPHFCLMYHGTVCACYWTP